VGIRDEYNNNGVLIVAVEKKIIRSNFEIIPRIGILVLNSIL